MEILHVFGIDWKLITIQMINFAVLSFILYRYAYKPILSMIEKRQQVIIKGLDDAEAVKKNLLSIESERVDILSKSRDEGSQIVQDLRKHAEVKAKETVDSAEERASAILIDAQQKANEEREYILRESEKEIAKMVVLGAEKILRTSSSKLP